MLDKTRWLAATLAAWTAVSLSAQERAAGDGESREPTTVRDSIVVTAHRRATDTEKVGSSVTVITAEEIALRGVTTAAELLRTVPGVEVVRGGGPGQITSVFVRGGNSSHTLVLLDGVRLNGSATGAFDFANLAADSIERVEIVRGPQSTLYGSEAMAGVISITSKRGGTGLRLSGLAEAGELDHQRWRLGIDGGGDRYDYTLEIFDTSTDGVSAAFAGSEDDPYDNFSAAARLGFDFAIDGRVDLTLRTFDGEVANDGFDFFAGPVDDLNRLQQRDGLTAGLRLEKQLGERWSQSFALGFNEEKLSGSDPDDIFSNFAVDSRSVELTAQSDVTPGEGDVLSFGLAYDERRTDNAGSFDESVDIVSFFVQNAWSLGERLHLTAGGRWDDHSQFGDEITYRIAASWELAAATRLHGSFGTGLKAPTLNDLFFPFFSNPDLLPETSEGFDLGVEQTFIDDRLTVDLTWFDTDFDDLIAFDFATFTPQNVAAASSSGIEVTLRYRASDGLQIAASHTYNDTEDLTTGGQLARRPEHRSTLSVYFRPVDRLRGSAILIAGRDRIDSDGSDMDDYERVDLTLRYRLSETFEPYLRLENLFDEEYQEINGFTTPGTMAVVGLGFKY